jgi:hypothetical protein
MNLDKYWVASLLVHFPSNSVSPSKAVLTAVAVALLLLASASAAQAEVAPPPEAPAVPLIQPAAAPVETATESVEAVTATVERNVAPTKTSPATTEAVPPSEVVDKATAAVHKVVQTTDSAGAAIEKQATAPRPASDTVVGAIAERSAGFVKEVAKDPVGTGRKLIEPVGNAVTKLTAPIVDLPVLEDPSQLGGLLTQKQGPVSTTPPSSPAIATGDFTSLLTVASPTSSPATDLAGLLTRASGGVASVERSQSSLADLQVGLDRVRTVALTLGEPRWGPVANPEQPPDRAPLDTPLPAAPSPAGTGSAGSTLFIPFVALLALLALAAPATQRRFKEVAAFRAPTPFVCALECPG